MVSKISLGTAQFGSVYGINSSNGKVLSSEVPTILNYARENSINLLDTAPLYGLSEKALGINDLNGFEIVTKTRHFENSKIGGPEVKTLIEDFSYSLKNLNKSNVYALLIHNADDLLKHGSKMIFDQLKIFKKNNLVKKIGVSVYDTKQIKAIIENFDIDIIQLPFNILDHRLLIDGIFEELQKREIEIHARSVFLQGLLLMNYIERPNKFNRWDSLWSLWHQWLNDNQISALEASIRYAMSFHEISRVLVGIDNLVQLKEVLSASNGTLPKIPNELFCGDSDLLNPTNWSRF
jgi:aryl-alcohol dehydrogenase-like predicted oxidoreductase